MEKTFKDFVNEVISEDTKKKSGFDQWLDSRKNKSDKNKEINHKQLLKNYADAFLLINPNGWNGFIRSVVKGLNGKKEITKYQFMQAFFNYYITKVYKNNKKLLQKCLLKASETIGMDEKDYSKNSVNAIIKIVKNGQKNKKAFVNVFDSLYRGGW